MTLTPEQASILIAYPFSRIVGDRYAAIEPMLWGKFRLKLGTVGRGMPIAVEYCYASVSEALEAMNAWDGTTEPTGWFRCPTDGRRRPDGDPAQEYVRP